MREEFVEERTNATNYVKSSIYINK